MCQRISTASIICVMCFFAFGCSTKNQEITLFKRMPADSTGINFSNNLAFDEKFNIYTYRNFYNGGGVALGDINNDGLLDIFFTSNQEENKLYLNKGNFQFVDITKQAGVGGTKAWSTGVSLADVNGDGWLDIYVCNSGDVDGDDKENELFINNRNLTFTESASQYGIADRGFTTHAVFFDYDRDHDLDLYILNNSYQAIGSFNLRKNERPKRDSLGGDKLFKNDNGHFSDVSEEAGIFGSIIGFGLGVTVGDINKDGWLDIYVSNDFFERDYLYVNNHNGTFRECLPEQMKSISGASMGADMADINNDAWPDIFVTEMLPETNDRIKTVTTFENWDRYQNNVNNDYYHQFTRNMLQLNNRDSSFSEVGRLCNMEATDWSWGALMFDVDNDGLKDVFVANGIYQDLTNQDYLQYVSSEEVVQSVVSNKQVNYKKLVELIPSTPVSDYMFQNLGDLTFVNKAKEWGIGEPNFSNGAAYGDLDNDGDLDLVVNNVNSVASVYKNEANRMYPRNRYLKFKLIGEGANQFAVGSKIEITHKDKKFYIEHLPNRGFESSVDFDPNIGLGELDTVENIFIEWPDGRVTELWNVSTNQTLKVEQKNAKIRTRFSDRKTALLMERAESPVICKHVESNFVDFDRERLIYHMLSTEGPRFSKGDVNGDGLEDFYMGGAKNSPGTLFVQNSFGGFESTNKELFERDKISEDISSVFFDADNDHDLDLYVCSGSNEFSSSSSALADRLYLNDGQGIFTKSKQVLPTSTFESSSVVKSIDYDNDGDQDLFVGIRSKLFSYGIPVSGYILNNDGKGNFANVSNEIAPELKAVGMVTDACWVDIDNDRDPDLVLVGEFMPVKIFINENGRFSDVTTQYGLDKLNGWWNRILPSDLDKDGDIDFVVANHGLNSRFKASVERPISMYVNDFDNNGTVEQIICTYNGDKSYPLPLRHDLMSQIPSLKKKYLKYESYKDVTIFDIFTKAQMEGATVLYANEMASGVLLNKGKGSFAFHRLPVEAQYAPMFAVHVDDFNEDGKLDILMGGNLYNAKPEVGRYDASYGVLMSGDGKGNFSTIPIEQSGLSIDGQIRDFMEINTSKGSFLLVARNNDSALFYKVNGK